MTYWIMIFNQHPLGQFTRESLISVLAASNVHTLCRQYGLDPVQIPVAMDHLDVEMSAGGNIPYFLVRYQPKNQPPIVVTEWRVGAKEGARLLEEVINGVAPLFIHDQLLKTRFIYSVALNSTQLADMGLLLAYELARWVAHRGSGWVLGLEGVWYRLNRHQAFIPLMPDSRSS